MAFGRRQHSTNPPPRTPPTAAAATAAAQAFLANRASNASLSNAAAAAALRSHTTTPTPVGQVQTKRMLQRQSSTSSHGSANGNARGPGGPQRQNSTGSMTERTFREPSPNRGSNLRMVDDDAPPMPPIPRAYASTPPIPAKSAARRPASVEPPDRISSPPPRIPGGRVVSLDRGPGGISGQAGRSKGRKSSLSNSHEHEREDYKASVNFSRPMSAHNTPPTSPLRETRPDFPSSTSNRNNINTMSTLPESEMAEIQYNLQDTARSPVKKKKKNVTTQGSHFANGGLGGKPSGTALAMSTHRQEHSPSAIQSNTAIDPNITVVRKKKKRLLAPDESRTESSQYHYASDSDASERSASSDRPRVFNTRAAGLLTKQPSVVREDREAEELEERGVAHDPSSIKSTQNGGVQPPAPKVGQTKSETKTEEPLRVQQIPPMITANLTPASASSARPRQALSEGEESSMVAKRNSLSPSRAAHFSSALLYETSDGVRHQPPPRSVSPAKSAMKHSPSTRGASPTGSVPTGLSLAVGQAPSEASDTTSVISDEGYRSQPKKKKNVRVSFEDDPTVVERALSPTSPESPIIASPQNRDGSRKGWFGLRRGGNSLEVGTDIEPDDTMRPTPTLPSFGSVRGRSEMPMSQQQPAEGQTSEHLGASNDHAVGAILAQDHASNRHISSAQFSHKASSDQHSPSGLASANDRGHRSDLRSDTNNEKDIGMQEDTHEESSNISGAQGEHRESGPSDLSLPDNERDRSVPSIAIQPATPGIEESSRTSRNSVERWLGMPGGFPPSTEFLDETSPESHPIVEHRATDPTPSAIGISEPLPDASPEQSSISPAVGEVAETMRRQTSVHEEEESESTDDSIYSDAAEDLSDVEGDGFGSINAIVESPTLAISKPDLVRLTDTTFQEQPTKTKTSEPQSEEGWDKAQAYWSGLSQSRKKQLEEDATPIPIEVTKTTESTSKTKKKKKTALSQETQVREAAVPMAKDRVKEGKKTRPTAPAPPIRKSMRGSTQSASEPSHMRSSMRSEVAPAKQGAKVRATRDHVTSSGSPDHREASTKKARPVSAVPMVDYNKSKQNGKVNHTRDTSDGVPSQSLNPVTARIAEKSTKSVNSGLRRAASDGSNSSSSFRKARPSTSDGGRYSMRRSMRSSSIDERPRTIHVPQSSAFSLRSNSPTGSTTRRPFSSAGPSMRTSLRGSFDAEPSRAFKSPTKSIGFGKGTKPKAASSKSNSRFSSRFGDSSDEEGGPLPYSSRFADSSDEDEPPKFATKLTPVRGIPKRIDEGDSTDLEDSSEEAPPVAVSAKSFPPKSDKAEGSALASGSLRRSGSDRDLSKSTDLDNGFQLSRTAEKEKKKRSFFGGLGRRKDSESRVSKPNVESASPRDTPLERNKDERVVGPNTPPSTQSSPRAPKLQRRNTPKRFQSDSWPLPQSPATTHTDSSRPNTSDGSSPVINGRPALGTRRSTVQENGNRNGAVVGKRGKKKRFPLLRKAFGLHD